MNREEFLNMYPNFGEGLLSFAAMNQTPGDSVAGEMQLVEEAAEFVRTNSIGSFRRNADIARHIITSHVDNLPIWMPPYIAWEGVFHSTDMKEIIRKRFLIIYGSDGQYHLFERHELTPFAQPK